MVYTVQAEKILTHDVAQEPVEVYRERLTYRGGFPLAASPVFTVQVCFVAISDKLHGVVVLSSFVVPCCEHGALSRPTLLTPTC